MRRILLEGVHPWPSSAFSAQELSQRATIVVVALEEEGHSFRRTATTPRSPSQTFEDELEGAAARTAHVPNATKTAHPSGFPRCGFTDMTGDCPDALDRR